MQKALIKIAYRQIIDTTHKGSFERNVLSASYNEFLIKSQAYNMEKKYTTFKEMVANDGRANSLHYKAGFAVGHFIEKLNNQIPELNDILGKSISFEVHQFEVIDSDITNFSAHKIAITYITGLFSFFGSMGECMLLAAGDKLSRESSEPVETFLLKMQSGLSIINYQPV